jgi:hypothetical protein
MTNIVNNIEEKIREIKAFIGDLIITFEDCQDNIIKMKSQHCAEIEKKDKEIKKKDDLIKELKKDLYEKRGKDNE